MQPTIKTRTFAAAYLLNGDRMLMMKRAETHRLFPGVWAPVGGHIEPREINDPEAAVLREIEEETGLTPSEVSELTLKYITIRIKENELRQQYLYFGRIERCRFSSCPEGELHLIPLAEVLERTLSAVNKQTLEYHFAEGHARNEVMVGTVSNVDGLPRVTWAPLQDWGDFPL